MLIVTKAATAHLAHVLADAPEGTAVRLTLNERSLTPRLDTPRDNDVSFEHQGRTVLLMEPELAGFLTDRVLDFRGKEGESHLILEVQNSDASVH
jgi:Fe-S cluster assembly iron-binding protein IscA